MDEASALLAAIVANPDEDTPRLVYADWLDEHGQSARAEFIRAQIELAHIEGDDPRRPALAQREYELLIAHRHTWVPKLPGGIHPVVFRRGFLAEVNAAISVEFTKYAGAIFAAHPVTAVWLNGARDPLRAVAACPHLARVRDLAVIYPYLDSLTHVLRSQFATGLRGLHLQTLARLGDAVPVLDLLDFVDLKRLSLHFAQVNRNEVRQFVRQKVVSGLNELTLDGYALRDANVRELVAAPAVAGLHTLRLSAYRMTDAVVQHLAESPHLAGLRRLSLFGAEYVPSDGLTALAAAPHLRNLTDLDLRSTRATTDDVRILFKSTNLPRLSRVVLTHIPRANSEEWVNTGGWNTCLPDHGPGVVWAAEVRAK